MKFLKGKKSLIPKFPKKSRIDLRDLGIYGIFRSSPKLKIPIPNENKMQQIWEVSVTKDELKYSKK